MAISVIPVHNSIRMIYSIVEDNEDYLSEPTLIILA